MARSTLCVYCGDPVDPDSHRTVRQITGHAENNKSGKPSKLVNWVEVGPTWHWYCWERQSRGGAQTESLF